MSEPQYDSVQQVRNQNGGRLFYDEIPAGLHLSSQLSLPQTNPGERLMVVVDLPHRARLKPGFVGIGMYGVSQNRSVRPIVPFAAIATKPAWNLRAAFEVLSSSGNTFFVGHKLFKETYAELKKSKVDLVPIIERSTDLWLMATNRLPRTVDNLYFNLSTERPLLFSATFGQRPKLNGAERLTEVREDQPSDLIGGRWEELFEVDAQRRSLMHGHQELTLAEQFLLCERDIRSDAMLAAQWLKAAHIQYEQAQKNEGDTPFLVKTLDTHTLKVLGGELPQITEKEWVKGELFGTREDLGH